MLSRWFRKKWFRKKSVPLTGAPPVRRQKSYSAASGYVYQYFYEGQRPSARERGVDFVFHVSPDRKTSMQVTVFVADEAVESWQREAGRTLSGAERYAIAKVALFQAFDARATPEAMREAVEVRPAGIGAILATLNID